ncbi:MAG: ferredoxin-type protein NapF [Gammaproteobacteria bacterium]|nr:ferredoxin-type protein NapF [Gammaproteobacteria bacterium]
MQLLRGGFDGGVEPVRPPWAIAEELFVELCSRCDHCLPVCPTKILERGRGGFPVVNFKHGECEFCGDCLSVCETGALAREADSTPPWNIKVAISQECIAYRGVVCRSCGEFCDERAIRFRPEIGGISKPSLELDLCSGCGACVAICPVSAVTISAPTRSTGANNHEEQLLEERV